MLYIILKYTIGPLLWLLWRPMIIGKENLAVKGKAVFASKHTSMLDPVLLAIISFRNIHFMAKKELFSNKLIALLLRSLLSFPVDRKNADLQSLKRAMKVLDKGKIFGIFPEGKRSITGRMDSFEKGTAFLAVRSRAPIIPIYIHPDSFRSGRPKMAVGTPIDINDIAANTKKSILVDVVTDEISDSIDALRIELEAKLEDNSRE